MDPVTPVCLYQLHFEKIIVQTGWWLCNAIEHMNGLWPEQKLRIE